eukprot:ANDGO_01939.mRNA.1 hypothetical protein
MSSEIRRALSYEQSIAALLRRSQNLELMQERDAYSERLQAYKSRLLRFLTCIIPVNSSISMPHLTKTSAQQRFHVTQEPVSVFSVPSYVKNLEQWDPFLQTTDDHDRDEFYDEDQSESGDDEDAEDGGDVDEEVDEDG